MNVPRIVSQHPVMAGAIAAFGALVFVAFVRRRPLSEATTELTGALMGAASDVAGGIFLGAAAVVGVPTTSRSACCAAIAGYGQAATTWERAKASFSVSARCPASDYLKWAAGQGAPKTCNKAAP